MDVPEVTQFGQERQERKGAEYTVTTVYTPEKEKTPNSGESHKEEA